NRRALRLPLLLAARVEEIAGYGAAQAAKLPVLIQICAGPRPWNIDAELGAERSPRSRIQRDDAIREHDRLVDVVRDQQRRRLVASPYRLDLVAQLRPRQRVERR